MVSLFHIFITFFKIGLFTFGGGLAMIPIIKRDIVDKGWIEEDVLADYIAVSQVAPGMIAINIATLVGNHLRGRKGSLASVFGVALPSLIVITLIAMFSSTFLEIPLVVSALKGILIVVVIFLAYAVITLGVKAIKNYFLLFYAILIFAVVFFFNVSTILALLSAFVIGTIHAFILYRKRADQ
ncbi:MAG: chromate transporter [Acholeplasmataceae bacterium]|nr:chromate transporter [Acholeplasmataceae bacterium]